jgi:hypothetical protein
MTRHCRSVGRELPALSQTTLQVKLETISTLVTTLGDEWGQGLTILSTLFTSVSTAIVSLSDLSQRIFEAWRQYQWFH